MSALLKVETVSKVTNGESGSCYKPATAIYKSRTPSLSTLASLKQSMSSTLSLSRNSSSSSAESHSDNFAGCDIHSASGICIERDEIFSQSSPNYFEGPISCTYRVTKVRGDKLSIQG